MEEFDDNSSNLSEEIVFDAEANNAGGSHHSSTISPTLTMHDSSDSIDSGKPMKLNKVRTSTRFPIPPGEDTEWNYSGDDKLAIELLQAEVASLRAWRKSEDTKPADGYEKMKLSDDTFSFLIACSVKSLPFVTAVVVLVFKTFIYGLIISNLQDEADDPDNPWGIPPSVSTPVRIGQVIALFITLMSQNDLLCGLTLLFQGYDDTSAEGIGKSFPHATWMKWVVTATSLILEGLLSLTVTFLLIITTSDNVVDLLLNFTAIEFVSVLDETVFLLSKVGFVGTRNKMAANKVEEAKYEVHKEKIFSHLAKFFVLVTMFVILFSLWIAVFYYQESGRFYSSNPILVQFDDAIGADLGIRSGVYVRDSKKRRFTLKQRQYPTYRLSIKQSDGRFVDASDGKPYFGYCDAKAIKAWTLSEFDGKEFDSKSISKPCQGILAKSTTSDANVDIADTLSEAWFATSSGNYNRTRLFVTSPLKIAGMCSRDDDCGGKGQGECTLKGACQCKEDFSGLRCERTRFFVTSPVNIAVMCSKDEDCGGKSQGKCTKSVCQCEKDFFGLRCGFDKTKMCRELVIDERTEPFVFRTQKLGNRYTLLEQGGKPIEIFGHPVYASRRDIKLLRDETNSNFNSAISNGWDLVMFVGLRWIIIHSYDVFTGPPLDLQSANGLMDYLHNNTLFDPQQLRDITFASEPVRFNTPNDIISQPENLRWFRVDRQASILTDQVKSRFLCGFCSPISPTTDCYNGFQCNITNSSTHGRCPQQCGNWAAGSRCEKVTAPAGSLGDSLCNTDYNVAELGYDGGDCCQDTCMGGKNSSCGYEIQCGNKVWKAFPNCIGGVVHRACGEEDSRVSIVLAPDDGDKKGRPGWHVRSGVDTKPTYSGVDTKSTYDAKPNENATVYEFCLLTESSYDNELVIERIDFQNEQNKALARKFWPWPMFHFLQ